MAATLRGMFPGRRALFTAWRATTRQVSSPTNAEIQPQELVQTNAENTKRSEEQVERLRDVSRLSPALRRRMRNEIPTIANDFQLERRYQRKLYAKFGRGSGVDPRIMWPTREELSDTLADESEYGISLQQKMENVRKRLREQDAAFKEREKEIARNLQKMPTWLEEYRKRQVKKRQLVQEKDVKKQTLIEKAREYYGYDVDPRDVRMQKMLAELEEKQKKEEKTKKKEERKLKAITKIQQLADTASAASSKS